MKVVTNVYNAKIKFPFVIYAIKCLGLTTSYGKTIIKSKIKSIFLFINFF